MKNKVAHKWCKEEKNVEGWVVSGAWRRDFHNLINIRVEILMQAKYFARTSARVLPSGQQGNFDRHEIRMVQYESGCAR